MKKIRYPYILLAASLLIALPGCKKNVENINSLRNVILTSPEPISGNESTDYPGIVEEGTSVTVSFMADGKISNLTVKEGDRVRKGQLLASLDDSDYKIGVSQLEAQFRQMSKEKERMDAMFEKHNIAPNDYEKFETGYEQLKLQLEMANRKLGYTKLYSPSDGYIGAKYMNIGELVGAGTPVFNIIDDNRLIASVDLPVNVYLDKNKIQSAKGRIPGIKEEIPLDVISFTPDADNNMLYHMKLAIPVSTARELTPGMNISVTLQSSEENEVGSIIPSRAIIMDGNGTYVWLYNAEDSTIHKKTVVIKGTPKGKMSVVTGLDNCDELVETGVKQLYEGEKVNIFRNK